MICKLCGKDSVFEKVEDFVFKQFGDDQTEYVVHDLLSYECDQCKETWIESSQVYRLWKAVKKD